MSPDLRELFDDAGRTPPRAPGWDADAVVRRGTTLRRRRRAVTVAGTGAALAVVVGGVALLGPLSPRATDPTGPTSRPTPTAATVTPSPSPSPTGQSTPPPTASPTPTPTSSRCGSADVSLALGQSGHAAGTTYLPVVATGTGSPCGLGDAPVVRALDASGAPIGAPAVVQHTRAGGLAPIGLVLQPSGHASVLVAFTSTANFDPAVCDPAPVAALAITVAPGTTPVRLALPAGYSTCRKDLGSLGQPLQVSEWQPTTTGLAP